MVIVHNVVKVVHLVRLVLIYDVSATQHHGHTTASIVHDATRRYDDALYQHIFGVVRPSRADGVNRFGDVKMEFTIRENLFAASLLHDPPPSRPP